MHAAAKRRESIKSTKSRESKEQPIKKHEKLGEEKSMKKKNVKQGTTQKRLKA